MGRIFIFLLGAFLKSAVMGQSQQIDSWLQQSINYRSNLDSALYYAQRAYDLSVEIGDRKGVAKSLVCKGVSYYLANQRDSSVSLLYAALPEVTEDFFFRGMALWYLGKLHVYARDFEKGVTRYHQAVEAFDQADSLYYSAHVLSGIGITYGMQTKYTQALDWFIRAYELKLSMGKEVETANELANISTVYMWLGNYGKALEFGWKGIELDDADDDSGNFLVLGGICNFQGEIDSALYYYEKGLELAQQANNPYTVRNALLNIANVYYQQSRHIEAIATLRQARGVRESRDQSTFGILTELGKNYQELGMLDSATLCLKEGLDQARQSKNVNTAHEASDYLGRLYAAMGQYDSAYYYAAVSGEYADSLNNDRIQDIFSNQRVRFETIDKEFEIERLEREAQLGVARERTLIAVVGGGVIILLLIFINYRSRMVIKQSVLQSEKEDLSEELEKNKAILSAHTLSMIHRKNGFDEIEARLDDLQGSGKQKIKTIISVNQTLEKDWDNFQTYFSQVHEHFFHDLKTKHSDLTQNEVRLAALVRLDLTNREIASLLNIEAKSVRMAKYRLKRKLGLLESSSLSDYLQHGLT